jgi:hypothetical protein
MSNLKSSKKNKLSSSKIKIDNIKNYLSGSRKMIGLYESLPLHKKRIFVEIYKKGYLEGVKLEDNKSWLMFVIIWFVLGMTISVFVFGMYNDYRYVFNFDEKFKNLYLGLISFGLSLCLAVLNKVYYYFSFLKKQKNIVNMNYELASKAYGMAIDFDSISKERKNSLSVYVNKVGPNELEGARQSMSNLKDKFAKLQDSIDNLSDDNILKEPKNSNKTK